MFLSAHGAILHFLVLTRHFRELHEIPGHLVYIIRYRLQVKGVDHH